MIQCALSLCQRGGRHLCARHEDVEGAGEKEPLLSHVTSISETSIPTALKQSNGRRNRKRSLSPDRVGNRAEY